MNHTAYDVMREYMIEGAELDGPYQFPMMPRYTGRPGTDTVDFKDSFDRRIKNHRDLTVNSISMTTNLRKSGIVRINISSI